MSMNTRPENKLETQFEDYGTLPKPRIIGRMLRFAVGSWLLYFLYQLVTEGADIFLSSSPPNNWAIWASMLVGLMITPYIINIGFSRNWKQGPRLAVVGVAFILVTVDVLVYQNWWALPLGVFVLAWSVYWSSHLGVSFVLSALIATPGCEMRAIPHLWTMMTGKKTQEHYCPGPFDRIDRWERGRRIE